VTIAVNNFGDGVSFTGGGDGDVVKFSLLGGRYGAGFNATWSMGSVTIRTLMPNGTTYIDAATAYSADGTGVYYLPAGSYEIVIATASAVQGFLVRIPYRA
jgi:hypothetical protein